MLQKYQEGSGGVRARERHLSHQGCPKESPILVHRCLAPSPCEHAHLPVLCGAVWELGHGRGRGSQDPAKRLRVHLGSEHVAPAAARAHQLLQVVPANDKQHVQRFQ